MARGCGERRGGIAAVEIALLQIGAGASASTDQRGPGQSAGASFSEQTAQVGGFC